MPAKGNDMRHTPEGMQNEPVNSPLANGENKSDRLAPNAMVCVYGHGPTKNPFYEEARALNATEKGALLILRAAVGRGEKLLLLSAAGKDPVEAQVVRTRTIDAQMFEVEIAFPFPQPDFWQPSRGSGARQA
jgi:hypothetical protein